jgi:hypothetical protein
VLEDYDTAEARVVDGGPSHTPLYLRLAVSKDFPPDPRGALALPTAWGAAAPGGPAPQPCPVAPPPLHGCAAGGAGGGAGGEREWDEREGLAKALQGVGLGCAEWGYGEGCEEKEAARSTSSTCSCNGACC